MSHDQGVRQWLADVEQGRLSFQELFPKLATTVTTYLTAFRLPAAPEEPARPSLVLNTEAGEMAVLFTDYASARELLGDQAETLVEYSAIAALQMVLRGQVAGAILNPASARLLLNTTAVRLLFREYAMTELARTGGAWVPTRADSLLVLEAMPRVYTIPVYLGKGDAQAVAAKTGGEAEWHDWSAIRARAHEAGTDGVYLQCDFPEQMGLTRPMVSRIAGDGEPDPLEELELAVSDGASALSSADLLPKLAELDRIWVLTDELGVPQAVGNTVDLFTNLAFVERFRRGLAHSEKAAHATPRFVKAKPLSEMVSRNQLRFAVNRSGVSL